MAPENKTINSVQKSSGTTNLSDNNNNKFQYEWTIQNFAPLKRKEIKSPIFSWTTSTRSYLWFLKLNPDNKLSLNLESATNDDISVKFKFTILNEGKSKTASKVKTKELSFTFDNKKKSEESWFEDQFSLSKQDTIIILFEGDCIIKTEEALPENKAIQEVLNLLYTNKVRNTINLKKGLLLFRDSEFPEKLENYLYSKLNNENAAEIYNFFYSHEKTELKNKVMEFITNNGEAVMATDGWKLIVGSSDMLSEIFTAFANKRIKLE